ncbi:MAG: redox-regulated ATPase YchF [Deltaproteobacteria bacterium]|nr:MAG: redox-regulated ATPase YchF [Deltaproteobacteria bacterium]
MRGAVFGEGGSGKTTLLMSLSALYGAEVSGKGRGGVVAVRVPDERVDFLASAFGSKKRSYVTVTLEEVQPGADALFDGQNLPLLKRSDFIILLVPQFPYSGGRVGEKTISQYVSGVLDEMCLSDYMVAEKRLERLVKEGKKDRERDLLERVVKALEDSTPLSKITFSAEENKLLAGFSFLTLIPMIVVVNVAEASREDPEIHSETEKVREKGLRALLVCASLEEEVMELPPEEREEFLREMGIASPAGERLLQESFSLLDQIVFLTAGPTEARAWNIRRGATAREAAGRIHSDMERGFIRAEVIHFDEFREFGDMAKAKSAGKVRLEGKDYVVQDGDILTIRFNV